MSKKFTFLALALLLCLFTTANAATVIWVSDAYDDNGDGEPDDQPWIDLLESNGYTVDLNFRNQEGRTLDDDRIAALNAADLIIVSRNSNSGDYASDATEVTQWNSVTTPLMLQAMHIIRSSRWLWVDSASTTNLDSPMMDFIIPDHPIFDGVTSPVKVLDETVGQTSFINTSDVGNGEVLAQTDDGLLWIAEWEEGVEFYPGSGQFAGGPRMMFVAGTQDVSPTTGRGMYNLTLEGEKIFLNAVRYLIGGSKLVKAGNPVPADGSYTEDIWVNLSWRPGESAVSHDLYIGEDFDAVSEGAEGTFVGNQSDTFIVVGFPGFPYPDGLVPGTTYYWRVDEVNEAEPNSPWKGDVWSFMVPPKTAYLPDPANKAQGVSVNPNLNWTSGFGAKIHTVYFGETFDEVDTAEGGQVQGIVGYSPGTLKMAKTYYWRVDEFDIFETYKGDVWSFTTEGGVLALDPANDAVDVSQTPVLKWTPGLGVTHEVYFGTDPGALEKKASGNLGSESFEPGQLEWNTTYYWRVDETDSANADSPWTGPVWSFTTANFLIIDDMESYNDLDPADPASNRIFNAWLDGYGDPTNGSLVGYDQPPFAEQNIVHGGNQSMPMSYDNSAVAKSEATSVLTVNRDWTINGVNTLTIWFRGNSDNAAETLYVALNGNARVDHDNPDAATITRWMEWNIDLTRFADQGVNLTNVNSITLGLSSVTGGTGMMYFDDIRLYALESAVP